MIELVFATLMRLVGPELEAVHVELATELAEASTHTDRVRCAAPLLQQPYDCPERTRFALAAIADRETGRYSAHVRWWGRHAGDSRFDRGLWRKGHRRGAAGRDEAALAPWCPAHDSPEGMSTSGPHGLILLYNVHRLHVPGNCVPWWIFASAPVSARAALDRYLELCERPRDPSWCPTDAAIRRALRRRCARADFYGPACREVAA